MVLRMDSNLSMVKVDSSCVKRLLLHKDLVQNTIKNTLYMNVGLFFKMFLLKLKGLPVPKISFLNTLLKCLKIFIRK